MKSVSENTPSSDDSEENEDLQTISFLFLLSLFAWLCAPVFVHACRLMDHLDQQLVSIAPDGIRSPYSVMHYIYYYLFAFPARGYTVIWKCVDFIGKNRALVSIAGIVAVLFSVFYTALLIAIYKEIQDQLSKYVGQLGALSTWFVPLVLYLGYVFFVRVFLDHDPFPTKLSGLLWLPTNSS